MAEKINRQNAPRKGMMGGPMGGPMGGRGPVEKAKNAKGTTKRLLGYLKEYKYRFLFILIFMAIATTATVFAPKIMGNATTAIFDGIKSKFMGTGSGVDFGYVGRILMVVLGLYGLSALFNYFSQYMMARVASRVIYRLRKDVNDKFSGLPLKYFDQNSKGDVLSRMTNDVDNINSTLTQSLAQIVSSIFQIIGIVIMMYTISWILATISLLVIPISVIITGFIAKYSAKHFKAQWALTGDLNGHVEETYSGQIIVKAFGNEDKEISKFNETNEKLYQSSRKAQFISGVIMPVINFLSNINYVAICVLGAVRVANGTMTIGDIQAFISYSKQFTQPISQVANMMNTLQSTLASAERIFELLDEEVEAQENPNPIQLKEVEGSVTFENMSFRYKEDIPLIENMNINVKSGAKIAIVGPTGAGKTTLVNLLMRFYDVNSGKITVDGVNIKDMRRGDLRRIFGMVLQDTWLFNGTIKDNIKYGNENATEEEIKLAGKAAQADHFIRTLHKGYDTVLEEDAGNISGGQKQLLTIARAFLADPAILILDEATSSVDTRTESLIQKAMETLMKGRTSFVIAHRLSTIKNADLILVMKEGTIIEQGNHTELLAQNGFYADLYNSQFTECIDDIA